MPPRRRGPGASGLLGPLPCWNSRKGLTELPDDTSAKTYLQVPYFALASWDHRRTCRAQPWALEKLPCSGGENIQM